MEEDKAEISLFRRQNFFYPGLRITHNKVAFLLLAGYISSVFFQVNIRYHTHTQLSPYQSTERSIITESQFQSTDQYTIRA